MRILSNTFRDYRRHHRRYSLAAQTGGYVMDPHIDKYQTISVVGLNRKAVRNEAAAPTNPIDTIWTSLGDNVPNESSRTGLESYNISARILEPQILI